MTREININKKLILILILINVLVIVIGSSYALFEITIVENSIIKIETGNIDVSLTSSSLNNNKLTLTGNETKEITITIENKSEINVLASLYYISGTTDIKFVSDTSFKDENNVGIGEINKKSSFDITLKITNNTSSSIEITLGVQGGYVGQEIILENDRNSILIEDSSIVAAELIKSKVGTGGLVAVNTSGTLYDGTGTIREYRYSGASVNNYIIFNDDGDTTIENNELWRIIGIFKDSSGNEYVKLIRNIGLLDEELPETYTINNTVYTIDSSDYPGDAYWNKPDTLKSKTYTDWKTAEIQYFLNTESDTNGIKGYYSTILNSYRDLINKNSVYYLGYVSYEYDSSIWESYTDTAIVSYQNERDATRIWTGNDPTWSGAIALMYQSDYGYSADSSYWDTDLGNYDESAAATSWMYQTLKNSRSTTSKLEAWCLTLADEYSDSPMLITNFGRLQESNMSYHSRTQVYPVFYLNKTVKLMDATGTINDPYRVVVS